MAEEGTKIVGEGEGTSLSPQVQEEKTLERARSKGWKPLDEFDGDPADWVPAKEFLGREKLFDKIHDLKSQLSRQAQKFESDMARIQQHFLNVQQTEYKRAKRELEKQLAQAKANEDVEAVAEIAGQIKDVEASQKETAKEVKEVKSGGPTPEFVDWQESNKWFNTDLEMTADAVAIGTGYAAANPSKSQKEVLDHVTAKIKRMYPEKFNGVESTKRMEDNRVESGAQRPKAKSSKGTLSVSDLNDMEKTVMRTLIKRGALKDVAAKNKRTQEEEYLAQLAERKAAE